MNWLFYAFTILSAAALTACASSGPAKQAQNVLSDYTSACQKGSTGAAEQYLLNPGQHIDPCPDEPLKNVGGVDLIAFRGNTQFSQKSGSSERWKIHPGAMLVPNSLHQVLSDLRYAIKAQDSERLVELLAIADDQSRESLREKAAEWVSGSRANALYASLASMASPWFQIDGNRALCDVSGIMLHLEIVDGRWRIAVDDLMD